MYIYVLETHLIDSGASDTVSLHSSGAVSTRELGVGHFSTDNSITEARMHSRVDTRVWGGGRGKQMQTDNTIVRISLKN